MQNIKTNLSAILAFTAIIVFIFIMYLALFSKNTKIPESPLLGKTAPSFTLKTFDNKTIDLNSLKGKSIVLNFWSSWCIPCKDETSALNRANLRYMDYDIVYIGVNIWDDKENALNFISSYPSHYTNAYDPLNEIHVNFGIQGVPETFFINKEGIILNRFQGELNDNILNYFSNQLLNNKL